VFIVGKIDAWSGVAQLIRTVLLDIQDNSPNEDPVVGYGGVVVLKGRGPGEEDSPAGYTEHPSPDEYPVVGYGGVVVLKGRGPGEQDSSAGDARHHGPTRGGGRNVLNLFFNINFH
jgi:hypothetical protein